MRLYITPSWRDAAEGHDAWSMESPDDRKRRSHTLPNGNANLQNYSDEAIGLAIGQKNKVSIPIEDRILPQKKRLLTLYGQMRELEDVYKSGQMDIKNYSLYRDVIVAKIERQEVLLKRAASKRPIRTETEEVSEETTYNSCDVDYTHTEVATSCGVSWMSDFIDDLPRTNSFKKILQIACKVVVKLVHFSQRVKAYYQTLKEV